MKQFGRQLHNQAKSVKLRAVERAELKERLQMYMEYHPFPEAQAQAASAHGYAGSTQRSFAAMVQKWIAPFTGVTAALLILVLPIIAEQAVPGDFLYPMKVQINEEVRSSLTFSSQGKIEWETSRIERRLAEVRVLATEGKLTDELEQAVAAAVRTHAKNTEAEIAALREIDADEAAVAEVSFASSLAVQSEVLSRAISEQATDAPASPVLLAVQSEEQEANERSADSAPSYERMLALIERETTTATELFNSIKESVPPAEMARIERRFVDLDAKISDTIANHAVTEDRLVSVLEVVATTSATATADNALSSDMSIAATGVAATGTEQVHVTSTRSSTTNATTADSVVETPAAADESTQNTKDAEGVAALRDILHDVKRLIRFMSDISVRESVSIDDWVPVALSTEERVTGLEELLAEIKHIQELVAVQDDASTTPATIQAEQQALMQSVFTIEELLQASEFEKAEVAIKDTYAEAQTLQESVKAFLSEAAATSTATTSDATTSTSSTDADAT